MVFETTTFILTIFKLYQKAAETHGTGSNLLAVLYRDGVFYYFVGILLFASSLAPCLFVCSLHLVNLSLTDHHRSSYFQSCCLERVTHLLGFYWYIVRHSPLSRHLTRY